jgi:hypothetical protein
MHSFENRSMPCIGSVDKKWRGYHSQLAEQFCFAHSIALFYFCHLEKGHYLLTNANLIVFPYCQQLEHIETQKEMCLLFLEHSEFGVNTNSHYTFKLLEAAQSSTG